MPRKLRIEYPGAIYHVMDRGDRREDIFHDEVDRYDFLKTLAEACHKTSLEWRREVKQTAHRLHLGTWKSAELYWTKWEEI